MWFDNMIHVTRTIALDNGVMMVGVNGCHLDESLDIHLDASTILDDYQPDGQNDTGETADDFVYARLMPVVKNEFLTEMLDKLMMELMFSDYTDVRVQTVGDWLLFTHPVGRWSDEQGVSDDVLEWLNNVRDIVDGYLNYLNCYEDGPAYNVSCICSYQLQVFDSSGNPYDAPLPLFRSLRAATNLLYPMSEALVALPRAA